MSSAQLQRCREWGIIALLLLGFTQIVGWLLNWKALAAIGFMSNAAPLPLVFSQYRGIEPFSSAYSLRFEDPAGRIESVAVTPEHYALLEGPYNLRNVYGAAFAFGARLETEEERQLWLAIMRYAFFSPGKLNAALGQLGPWQRVEVIQESRARGIEGRWVLPVTAR